MTTGTLHGNTHYPAGPRRQRGAGLLVAALFLLLVIALIGSVSLRLAGTDIADTSLQNNSVEALFLAESGVERALQRLAAGTACAAVAQPGTRFTLGRGDFEIQTSVLNATTSWCDVRILGRVLLDGNVSAQRQIEVALQPSSGGAAAWAAGSSGAMYAWSGSSWSAGSSGTTEQFNGVHCANATNCWAVGTNGVIRRWTGSGTNWTTVASGTSNELRGVSCIIGSSPLICYAVGSDVVRRWNGSAWGASTFSGALLRSVSCSAATCYAVDDQNRIWALNSATNTWSVNASLGQDWNAIHCLASGECWATGEKSANNFTFARRNSVSGAWSTLLFNSPPAKALYGIHCTASDTCWAVGEINLAILRAAGSFTRNTLTGLTNLMAVHCISTNNCLTVGLSSNASRWDGSSWLDATSGLPAGVDLRGVAMTGASGGGGAGVQLMRWRELIL